MKFPDEIMSKLEKKWEKCIKMIHFWFNMSKNRSRKGGISQKTGKIHYSGYSLYRDFLI
jgi:hypothetical protein